MVFVTLITDREHIKNFTYLQNFNSDGVCNRFAASGIYSDQVSGEGLSFITAECPTTVGSDTWEIMKVYTKKFGLRQIAECC